MQKEGLDLYTLFQNISRGEFEPLSDAYSMDLRDLVRSMLNTNPKVKL